MANDESITTLEPPPAVPSASRFVCRTCGHETNSTNRVNCCPTHDTLMVLADAHAEHPRDRILGATIANEYAVIGVIGSGGFGTVYLGVQTSVNRPVAIKVLHARYAEDLQVRSRFAQEARAIAALDSDHVVRIISYGDHAYPEREDRFLYMVLEYIQGRTLSHYLKAHGPLPADQTVRIGVQVLDALAEAHARGVVHRDLKPANVMLTRSILGATRVKVLDFGVAKIIEGKSASFDGPETKTGAAPGTPSYMSPEQVRGEGIGPASDLYALGVILYRMLAGQVPFSRDNAYMTLFAHMNDAPPPFDPQLGVPAGLADVIYRALEKKADARFASAPEMSAALQATLLDGTDSTQYDAPPAPIDGLLPATVATEPSPTVLLATDDAPASGALGRTILLGCLAGIVIGAIVFMSRTPDSPSAHDAAASAMAADAAVEPINDARPTVQDAQANTPASDAASVRTPPDAAAGAPPAARPERKRRRSRRAAPIKQPAPTPAPIEVVPPPAPTPAPPPPEPVPAPAPTTPKTPIKGVIL